MMSIRLTLPLLALLGATAALAAQPQAHDHAPPAPPPAAQAPDTQPPSPCPMMAEKMQGSAPMAKGKSADTPAMPKSPAPKAGAVHMTMMKDGKPMPCMAQMQGHDDHAKGAAQSSTPQGAAQ